MFGLSEHEWREVDVDVTRRVCPCAARPDVGCSIAYFVDGDGRWVKDCGMAGIGSECVWAHPDKELPNLLPDPIEYPHKKT